ncbi:MAG: isopentenyl-diphosphate Delta-isomerase [Bacteroidia bacterium]|jgi:isopentenyl-diphosphate delta-isomerase|nr:isopentenyl-diphosphate Delta-isomerase [Bacteroidia bacterium]
MIDNDVILVDEFDQPIGTMEKMEAHVKAALHRAISVFIFNSKGEWLLQRRAIEKYHSRGLWTNTSCTHPAPGETSLEAAHRRLHEEMGLKAELREVFSFKYIQELENNLTEHEYDHVFVGYSDELPVPNPDEVMDYKYISYQDLLQEVAESPEKFTAWFKMIYERVGNL